MKNVKRILYIQVRKVEVSIGKINYLLLLLLLLILIMYIMYANIVNYLCSNIVFNVSGAN